ncbi:unnamed protein product [Strongylus vulgaris]|uniref:Uncharacterized protein n=1 Tax=Strongylus vulgaris TaxID=40348 RepID=A0A3P7K3Q1_STRVU|nr:unnamed protein product [Strongylus vulgaris]
MMLEEMGLFKIFREAISIVLGEQAWQLEEALGFGAYEFKPCSKPEFLNEDVSNCVRQWDLSTPMCTCSPGAHDVAVTASMDSSNQFRGYRLRTTSLRDMPKASAACYEEFLHGIESHEGVELPSPNDLVSNTQDHESQASSAQSPFVSNDGNIIGGPLIKIDLTYCGMLRGGGGSFIVGEGGVSRRTRQS